MRIATVVALLWAPALLALNNRSAVSVNGVDTNPCTTLAPCRTYTAAIAATNSGGEVIALDSGGYGPFTISMPLTVAGAPGVHAAISVASGAGITVAASAAADRVLLKNLVLIGGGGATAIADAGAQELTLIDCFVRGFTQNGVLLQAGTGNLSVQHCTFIENAGATAINQEPPGVVHNVLVSDSLMHGNQTGIHGEGGGNFVVVNTTITGHNFEGVNLVSQSGTNNVALLTMVRCTVAHNDTGILVFIDGTGNVATASVSQSVIAFNGLAVFNNGGGQQSFNTFADNRFVFNGQDITGPSNGISKE